MRTVFDDVSQGFHLANPARRIKLCQETFSEDGLKKWQDSHKTLSAFLLVFVICGLVFLEKMVNSFLQ